MRSGRTGARARRGAPLLALVLGAVLAGCGGKPAVSLPPDSAPPEVVLDVYLRALVAGDCETAAKLTFGTFDLGNGELCGYVTVTAFEVDSTPATPTDHEVVFATKLTMSGGDGSIRDGTNLWFYQLQRQANGSWRLTGGGTGP
jgi:hypothetical protein